MQTRRLGRTGLMVSEVCLGTMTFGNQADEAASFAIMDAGLEAGVNFFDTADVYPLGGGQERAGRTEEIVGKWLAERGARERIVLATKCAGQMGPGPNDRGLSRKHVIAACAASLKRLKTDYVDLYQTHWPDPETPPEETLEALDWLVRQGMVRYTGCSNYPAWRITEALGISARNGLAAFGSAQPRYNLLFRMIEDEILPACQAFGVGILAYNPLAGGMLTGRYRERREPEPGTRFTLAGAGPRYRQRYWNEAVFEVVDGLARFLEPRGKSLAHVALAWVLGRPGVTSAILGASRPEQLADSLGGVGLQLAADELAACDEAWFALPRERDRATALR
jgi:aryl-alcohol dehydrogenase-like predicted oxidoreductase